MSNLPANVESFRLFHFVNDKIMRSYANIQFYNTVKQHNT